MRVHIHTDDPGAALTVGTSVGTLAQVKVDNIRRQAERFVEMHEERSHRQLLPGPPSMGTVAVVAGEGMRTVFESSAARASCAAGRR